jgi:GTP 3',8-cyclase
MYARLAMFDARPQTPAPLVDTFARVHDNLRISVTDRCNIRCFYCMPDGDPTYVPRRDILSYEEIERFVRIAAQLGVTKIRLTGGEPLVRRDLSQLVAKLAAIPGIRDVALTTNGILLAEQAANLYAAGLRRLNVHLDTLDAAKFEHIVRRPGLDKVLRGLDTAKQLGFSPIKLNAVAVKGETEDDIVPLARFGRDYGFEVRFIEYMPLDAGNAWERSRVLLAANILERLGREIAPLVPGRPDYPGAPASEFSFSDGVGRIGIIASVSQPFCRTCNRIRITADGKLRNCLFALEELDVKSVMRRGGNDDEIAELLRHSVRAKWEGHEINTARFVQPPRPMYAIGG